MARAAKTEAAKLAQGLRALVNQLEAANALYHATKRQDEAAARAALAATVTGVWAGIATLASADQTQPVTQEVTSHD